MTEQEEKQDWVLDQLVKTNKDTYNHTKAVEELVELSQVLMQKVNKLGGPKEPKDQAIIDEIGDTYIRLSVLSKIYGEEDVVERIDAKINKFYDYLKNNKYIGRI